MHGEGGSAAKRMKLRKFDGQCVRLTDGSGNVFEGICHYNSRAYMAHEIGPDEDGLQIECFVFERSNISDVVSLEDHDGPHGKFTAPFGTLEEMTVESGADLIEEALDSEESVHVLRLLRCLGRHLDPAGGAALPERAEVIRMLRELAANAEDPAVGEEAGRLAEKWG